MNLLIGSVTTIILLLGAVSFACAQTVSAGKRAIVFHSAGLKPEELEELDDHIAEEVRFLVAHGYVVEMREANQEAIVRAIVERQMEAMSYFGHGMSDGLHVVPSGQSRVEQATATSWQTEVWDALRKGYEAQGLMPAAAGARATAESANFGLEMVRNFSCYGLADTTIAHLFVKPGGWYYGVGNAFTPLPTAETLLGRCSSRLEEYQVPASGYRLAHIKVKRVVSLPGVGRQEQAEVVGHTQRTFQLEWVSRPPSLPTQNHVAMTLTLPRVPTIVAVGSRATFAAILHGVWDASGYGEGRDYKMQIDGAGGLQTWIHSARANDKVARDLDTAKTSTIRAMVTGRITEEIQASIAFGPDHQGTMSLVFVYGLPSADVRIAMKKFCDGSGRPGAMFMENQVADTWGCGWDIAGLEDGAATWSESTLVASQQPWPLSLMGYEQQAGATVNGESAEVGRRITDTAAEAVVTWSWAGWAIHSKCRVRIPPGSEGPAATERTWSTARARALENAESLGRALVEATAGR